MKLLGIILLTTFSFILVANITKDAKQTVSLIFAGIICLFYFLPAFVAYQNKHINKGAITALNVFLGWTFIGWIAALIWSLTKKN